MGESIGWLIFETSRYQEVWSPATLNRIARTGQDAGIGWALSPKPVGPRRLAQEAPLKSSLERHWTQPPIGVLSTVVSGLKEASIILSREMVHAVSED